MALDKTTIPHIEPKTLSKNIAWMFWWSSQPHLHSACGKAALWHQSFEI